MFTDADGQTEGHIDCQFPRQQLFLFLVERLAPLLN